MTYGLWHAIHAIVATHAKHNRADMLTAIAEQRDRHEMPSQDGVTPVKVSSTADKMGGTDRAVPGNAGNKAGDLTALPQLLAQEAERL